MQRSFVGECRRIRKIATHLGEDFTRTKSNTQFYTAVLSQQLKKSTCAMNLSPDNKCSRMSILLGQVFLKTHARRCFLFGRKFAQDQPIHPASIRNERMWYHVTSHTESSLLPDSAKGNSTDVAADLNQFKRIMIMFVYACGSSTAYDVYGIGCSSHRHMRAIA